VSGEKLHIDHVLEVGEGDTGAAVAETHRDKLVLCTGGISRKGGGER